MNLYLFEYMYADGQRWEIVANTFAEAIEYFIDAEPNIDFTIDTAPEFNDARNWNLRIRTMYGTVSIGVQEKQIHKGIL